MAGGRQISALHAARIHEQFVIRLQRIDHRLGHDGIRLATEDPHPVVGEVRDRVDAIGQGEFARDSDQFIHGDRFVAPHAATKPMAQRVLRTVIRSGGQAIALPILAPHYLGLGVDANALHRVVAIASGGLDSLPHNGYVVTTIRGVCRETHKSAYWPMFCMTVLVPLFGLIVALLLL